MGGDLAPKIKRPLPKRVAPDTPQTAPADPVHPVVAPGYQGHPGGNALDALAKRDQPPPPTTPPGSVPRRPDAARSALSDAAHGALFFADPSLFGPSIESLEDQAARLSVIELKGHPLFVPSWLLARYIQGAGEAGAVLRVRYSHLCSGTMVIRWDGCAYQSDSYWLPINSAELVPRDPASRLGLAVWLVDNEFHGLVTTAHATVGKPDALVDDPEGLFKTVLGRSYHGPDSLYVSSYENALAEGELRVVVAYDLHPPDGPTINGLFSLIDEDFRFMGNAVLSVEGADVDPVHVTRSPRGILQAIPNLKFADGWAKHGFHGQFAASFFDGSFEARGRVALAYPEQNPFIKGLVNVVATTPDKAWAAANANDPSPHITGGISSQNATDQGLALVGWGRLDLILAAASPKKAKKDDSLNATALFLVDPEGEITARGIFRVPRTYELIPPYKTDTVSLPPFPLHKLIVGGEVWGPFGGEVRLFADLDAYGTLGPFSLRDLTVDGTYSTRQDVATSLALAASFNASAEAHVSAKAGIEVRATVGVHLPWPLPDIDAGATIASVHVGGDASLKGYIDARPEIQATKPKDATQGPPQFSVHGEMHVAGELLAKIGGGLSVLGQGVNAGKTIELARGGYKVKIDHTFGTDTAPTIEYEKVPFDPKRFVAAATDPGTKSRTDPHVGGKFHEQEVKGHKHEPDAPVTATETPLATTPDRPFEATLPVKIHEEQHTLYLVVRPNEKSDLEIKSPSRRRVLLLIDAAIESLDSKLSDPWLDSDEDVLFREKRAELADLRASVVELIGEANAFAPSVELMDAGDLPEYLEVGAALAEYGQRYGEDDIVDSSRLLTEGILPTEVKQIEPARYRYLGAARIGNTSYFEGSFDESEGWRWGPDGEHPDLRAWPTGPVTRHPVNKQLKLRDVVDLVELRPSGPYKTIDKETTGAQAIEGDLEVWRATLDRRAAKRRDEILVSEPEIARGTALNRAKGEIEQYYVDLGYPRLPFHALKVIKESTWYCHHIHESSWSGSDDRTNLIYLVLATQHAEITSWFEDRRDDVERYLEIPARRKKRKTP